MSASSTLSSLVGGAGSVWSLILFGLMAAKADFAPESLSLVSVFMAMTVLLFMKGKPGYQLTAGLVSRIDDHLSEMTGGYWLMFSRWNSKGDEFGPGPPPVMTMLALVIPKRLISVFTWLMMAELMI